MKSSGVTHRRCSLPLQRVIADFGGDQAFGRVNKKLKEHYGITVADGKPRSVTLRHAKKMGEMQRVELREEQEEKSSKWVISETDGSMVPIVTSDANQADKRKKKTLGYREARLTLAYEKGSTKPFYAGTFQGVDEVGERMGYCVKRAGIDETTQVHCVGDGAVWIAEQVEKQFGGQATYLVDMYHVSEYLSEAAGSCTKKDGRQWVEKQMALLKKGQVERVLVKLKKRVEHSEVEDNEAPVRRCYRYLNNRLNQLDYERALENGLPIGSGRIESGHRHVIQERLKLAGGWWLEETAENMLALRTVRANDDWEAYWQAQAA